MNANEYSALSHVVYAFTGEIVTIDNSILYNHEYRKELTYESKHHYNNMQLSLYNSQFYYNKIQINEPVIRLNSVDILCKTINMTNYLYKLPIAARNLRSINKHMWYNYGYNPRIIGEYAIQFYISGKSCYINFIIENNHHIQTIASITYRNDYIFLNDTTYQCIA